MFSRTLSLTFLAVSLPLASLATAITSGSAVIQWDGEGAKVLTASSTSTGYTFQALVRDAIHPQQCDSPSFLSTTWSCLTPASASIAFTADGRLPVVPGGQPQFVSSLGLLNVGLVEISGTATNLSPQVRLVTNYDGTFPAGSGAVWQFQYLGAITIRSTTGTVLFQDTLTGTGTARTQLRSYGGFHDTITTYAFDAGPPAVPEPSTAALAVTGAAALMLAVRRRRK